MSAKILNFVVFQGQGNMICLVNKNGLHHIEKYKAIYSLFIYSC